MNQNQQNRSENFNFFSDNSKNNSVKKKTVWQKIWFWTKIVIYVLLFGITMTGCVQSITTKMSNYSGAGTEFYLSKNKISPNVTTYAPNVAQNDEAATGLKKGQFYELAEKPEANYYLKARESETNQNILNALREQTKKDGGDYAKWYSKSSSLQILDQNGKVNPNEPIEKGKNGYVYRSETANQYTSAYESWNEYVGKILDPNFSLTQFYKFNKDKNIYEFDTSKVKIGEKEYDRFSFYDFVSDSKNPKKLKYVSLYSIASSGFEKANRKYARDVFESLYRKTFVNNPYYDGILDKITTKDAALTSYEKWMQKIVDYALDNSKDGIGVKELTPEQLSGLIRYNATVKNYLLKTKLLDTKEHFQYKKDGKDVTNLGWYKSNVLGEETNNQFDLINTQADGQIAITSWAESWKLGPFFSLFAYPIAALTLAIREPMPSLGGWSTIITIFVAVLLTRLIVLGFTWKATVNQSRQEDLRAKKAKIDAKYEEFKDNKQMKARQQQEIAALYKKNGINMLDSFLTIFISFPIFIAMWRVIQSIPDMKSTTWLGMEFAATSWRKLFFNGEWPYLFILILAGAVQVIGQLLPRMLNYKKTKERITLEEAAALRKSNKTQNILLIVFLIFALVFSCGVQVYWILSGLWNIGQTLAIHYFKKTDYFRKKYLIKKV